MFTMLVVYQWGVWENTRKLLQVLLKIREISSFNLCFCSFSVGTDGDTSFPLRASVPQPQTSQYSKHEEYLTSSRTPSLKSSSLPSLSPKLSRELVTNLSWGLFYFGASSISLVSAREGSAQSLITARSCDLLGITGRRKLCKYGLKLILGKCTVPWTWDL